MPTQHFKPVSTETTLRAESKMRTTEEVILFKLPEGSTIDTIVTGVSRFYGNDSKRTLADFLESMGFDRTHPKFHSLECVISAIRQCLAKPSHVDKTTTISDVMKKAILKQVGKCSQATSKSVSSTAAEAAIARPARSDSTNEGSARSAARHSTMSTAPPPVRITPELVEKGWYQKSLPNLGLVFIRPEIVFPETEIASLVPGVDYFGTEQEVAKHLSNTNPRDVENWTTAWRELCSNGWRHEYKEDLGLVYIRPNATFHFAPDYDYFVHPRDVLAFVDEFKNPSLSNITDSKPAAAKRPSIAENNDESCYKRHALPSDGSWRKVLPTASNLEQQAAKKQDEPQDDLEHLRNEIKNLRGCLRSINSLLPEDKHVPAEFKLLFKMIRGKIPANICD